ncbi:hypothetical protein [Hymenobacter sp. HSC-4F20]|uniref:hypothetical protein n=1 Tax=Hymenobacter sp. HSC-4F20 TaxID=2864135 RepID=UPI001C73A7B6|nr:hypothetical protein [Hymenobacter sp. HSC-4F20]
MAYSWPALFGGGMRERMIVGVPGHPDLLLSTGRKKFQQEMLTIVGDDPVLARQLQQDELGPDMAQPLFESYVRQKMQGTPTASVTNGQ